MTSSRTVPALELSDISFVRDGRKILDAVTMRVEPGQNWLVLGANGSGKTTLVRIAALYEHPTRGSVSVLGETLGATDVRSLRRRIGYVSASFASELRPAITARDAVMTARHAALEPWWHHYDEADRTRADECLESMGVGRLSARAFGTLSSGEQQRVLLARSMMNDPAVLLFDEPSARLDLGGREELVSSLTHIISGDTRGNTAPPVVLVTHHIDEVPLGMTHVMMLRDGQVIGRGPIESTLSSESISECFGVRLQLDRRPNGRLTAWSA